MSHKQVLQPRPVAPERKPDKKPASDRQMTIATTAALYWCQGVPRGKISVRVENSLAILDGEVFWNHEHKAALNAMCIDGIKGISDNIRVVSEAGDLLRMNSIRKSLAANTLIDERTITVKVYRNNVTLTGRADTISRKTEAGRISVEEPGIENVDNRILVRCFDNSGHRRFLSL